MVIFSTAVRVGTGRVLPPGDKLILIMGSNG
jgi:hypothetical protein